MRKVERSALVPYSSRVMFRLVDDVESYPDFLPWCSDAVIEEQENDATVATLELHKSGMTKRFTTRNSRRPYSAIDLALVGGPFRHLAGGWRFRDLGEGGCEVSLDVEFAFDNRLVDMMFGPFFEDTRKSLVDAFIRRAAEVYGSR
jgi:ribosome-associated toxin RatA of RatAB toxin-antitoxin module